MAQPAIITDFIDATLVARAQRYERDALAGLCDRSLDTLYRMCAALAGDPDAAESIAAAALLKALDGLPGFDGGAGAFHIWVLRLGASGASRRRPQAENGIRAALAHLTNFDYELVSLRLLADIDVDHLAPVLNAQPASLRAWLVTALRELDGRTGTGWGPDLRSFDGALREVADGADPEQVAEHVTVPGDAPALLRIVRDLRGLLDETVPPAVATRLRTTLLAAAAERRALWVHRHHAVATVPGIDRRRYSTRTGTVAALAVAGVLAVVVGSVLAVLSSFAGPTSGLYELKRSGESILLAANLDPVDRAGLEVKLAETRDREAEDMAGLGNGDLAVQAVDSRFTMLRAAGHDLLLASAHDARWRAARDRYLKESDVQMTSIERDLQATGQARSAAEVQQLATQFQADRQPVDSDLGVTPPPQPDTGNPAPTQPAAPPG
ncbi:MAG TPA: DUF5667 domain-containing protein [Candidatus Dormibacteraeota bacterium]|nr:DUF5667 domain-containing protein [Candidatus Dormibacteraeota bacterium]